MKIALFQMNIIWEDKKQNLSKLRTCLDKLRGMEVDLLLLPEMSLTGFSMNTNVTAEKNKETIAVIKELAKEYNISIGIGWTSLTKDEYLCIDNSNLKDEKELNSTTLCENHYTIVTPEKEELIDYIKLHPFSYAGEDKYFKSGDKLEFANYLNFNISTAICYDLRFPEVFQIMSKKADIIIVPANWPKKRAEHWKALLIARAIENQSYIVGINCVGNINNIDYSGDSVIINPNGEIVKPIQVLKIDFKCDNYQESKCDNYQDFKHDNYQDIKYDNYQDSKPDNYQVDLTDAKDYVSEQASFCSEEGIFIYEIKNDVEAFRNSFPVKKDRRESFYGSYGYCGDVSNI